VPFKNILFLILVFSGQWLQTSLVRCSCWCTYRFCNWHN